MTSLVHELLTIAVSDKALVNSSWNLGKGQIDTSKNSSQMRVEPRLSMAL